MSMNNLFDSLPAALPDEVFETLHKSGDIHIERIVSLGHSSPEGFWYDQEQDEWVVVLRGVARLRFEEQDEAVDMKPGDFVLIPAGARHRVEWTTPDEPTIWLAVHHPADRDARPKTT